MTDFRVRLKYLFIPHVMTNGDSGYITMTDGQKLFFNGNSLFTELVNRFLDYEFYLGEQN